MRKNLISLTCIAALSLGLAACGTNSASNTDASKTGASIQWDMWGSSDDDLKWLSNTIKIVKQKVPEVSVDLQSTAWGDYWTKLTTNLSSGNVPCILGINSTKLDTYAAAYSPITKEDLKTAGIELSAYKPGILDMFKYDGKQLGIPFDVATMLVYYNKDAFKKAGIADPKVDWNFAEFEQAAKAVTTNGGMKGFAVSPAEFQVLALPIDKAGRQPISKDSKIEITNPEFVSAMTWYSELVTKQKVADPVGSASDTGWGENQFSSGNAAMAVDGSWNAVSYIKGSSEANAPKFETGFLPLPKGEKGRTQLVLGSGYGISATCKHRTAALKVLGALVSKEAQDLIANSGRSYPAITASQAAYFKSVPKGQGEALKATLNAAFDSATGSNHAKNWTKVSDALANQLVQVYNNQGTMNDALTQLQQQFGQ